MGIVNFFHHLFNPHCLQCKADKECLTCDTLRQILAEERYEKRRLLDRVFVNPDSDRSPEEKVEVKPIKVGPTFTPWRMRAAQLEQMDKERHKENLAAKEAEKAQIVRSKSIEELEAELGVENG